MIGRTFVLSLTPPSSHTAALCHQTAEYLDAWVDIDQFKLYAKTSRLRNRKLTIFIALPFGCLSSGRLLRDCYQGSSQLVRSGDRELTMDFKILIDSGHWLNRRRRFPLYSFILDSLRPSMKIKMLYK